MRPWLQHNRQYSTKELSSLSLNPILSSEDCDADKQPSTLTSHSLWPRKHLSSDNSTVTRTTQKYQPPHPPRQTPDKRCQTCLSLWVLIKLCGAEPRTALIVSAAQTDRQTDRQAKNRASAADAATPLPLILPATRQCCAPQDAGLGFRAASYRSQSRRH